MDSDVWKATSMKMGLRTGKIRFEVDDSVRAAQPCVPSVDQFKN